jgi:hypothetical protein
MVTPEHLAGFVADREIYVKEVQEQGKALQKWHESWRQPFLDWFRRSERRYPAYDSPGTARKLA